MKQTVIIAQTKQDVWDNIQNGARVEFLANNNRTYQGVMTKGEFRTKWGSYSYVTNEHAGTYTVNEVLSIKPL